MKFLAFALSALAILLSGTSTAQAKSAASACPGVVKGIYFYRDATRHWERMMGQSQSKSNFNASKVRSCRYAKWVAHKWVKLAKHYRGKYKHWRELQNDPEYAICLVFGPYCSQAKAVAWCEGKYSPYAHNGQYQGTFQMGERERTIYGHGATVLEQARAAYRYFVASGRNWSPWECKP